MKATKKVLVLLAAVTTMMVSALPAAAATTEVAITSASVPTSVTLLVGKSQKVDVSTLPGNATYKTDITWDETTNDAYSYVENGHGTKNNQNSTITLTGKKAGKGTLKTTIKTYNAANKIQKKFVVTTQVNVVSSIELTKIALNKTSGTLNVGKTESLSVSYYPTNTTASKTVTWTSSNTKIATVASGKVTAKAPGTATITAKCAGKTATYKVTVKAPLTKIALNKTSLSLETGKTSTLTVAYTPSNTTDSKTVTWTSSNTALATVSGGKITAKKAGTVTITAKVGTKTATCKVTIKAAAGKYINVNDCYTRLNNYRTAAKVRTLTKDTALENIAKTRAKELVTSFSHTRPNGQSGLSLIPGNIYKGENIAKGQTTTAQVSTAWYNSAGHKANMLKANYTKVGIAGYEYNGTMYWVQIFSS